MPNSENKSSIDRRKFLAGAAIGVVSLPFMGKIFSSTSAFAVDCKEVDATNPVAKALKYVSKSPKKENLCSNCVQYKEEKGCPGMGKCTMITAGLVNKNGYCNSWAKKA